MDFILGFIVAGLLGMFNMYGYKRILTDKADSPQKGTSNVEFIHGKPYVIMHEKDYIKNCKVWYENRQAQTP